MKTTFSIGEFSRVTGLSVKTLRFYHEKGLLLPSEIDQATGYRSYDPGKIERARIIMRLREMEFSIEDIAALLGDCSDEADILDYLERRKTTLQQRVREDRDIIRSLDEIIAKEMAAKRLVEAGHFTVEQKTVPPLLVAGFRMKGKYLDCGAGFSRLAKSVGRSICGKPLCLFYDSEYREEDAEFEPCFPVRKAVPAPDLSIRTLPAASVLTLIHRGPYDQLGRSYAKILGKAREQEIRIALPTREVYIKGPGMILRGNPANYLTEIQLPLEA